MTILSESTAKCATPLAILFVLAALIVVMLGVAMCVYDCLKIGLVSIIAGVLVFVTTIVCYFEPYREIKVLLSDDYPAKKLYDEYVVKERDGDIWILRDKEPIKK